MQPSLSITHLEQFVISLILLLIWAAINFLEEIGTENDNCTPIRELGIGLRPPPYKRWRMLVYKKLHFPSLILVYELF